MIRVPKGVQILEDVPVSGGIRVAEEIQVPEGVRVLDWKKLKWPDPTRTEKMFYPHTPDYFHSGNTGGKSRSMYRIPVLQNHFPFGNQGGFLTRKPR